MIGSARDEKSLKESSVNPERARIRGKGEEKELLKRSGSTGVPCYRVNGSTGKKPQLRNPGSKRV